MSLKLKVKKGDYIIITKGKDIGKKSRISKVFPKSNKVLVEGLNIAKKHLKPSKNNPQGGIVSKEMQIDISNISHIDPKTDLPTKIGYKIVDGEKVRFAKKSGELLNK